MAEKEAKAEKKTAMKKAEKKETKIGKAVEKAVEKAKSSPASNSNSEKDRLLKIRKEIKTKKPVFRREQYAIFIKLRNNPKWRRPKGRHSKIRQKHKGHSAMPRPSYGAPAAIRSMHPSGFFEKIVHNPMELDGIDKKMFAIRIASTVGTKKKIAIVEKAKKMDLKVLNPKLRVVQKVEEKRGKAPEEKKEQAKG